MSDVFKNELIAMIPRLRCHALALTKSAAALLLESRIGEQFSALVTGASAKGTWARLLSVPAEGRVVQGFEGADVGDQIRVQLKAVDVERGFIDLVRVGARAQ